VTDGWFIIIIIIIIIINIIIINIIICAGQYRAILTWNGVPADPLWRDIDSHLYTPWGCEVVYYRKVCTNRMSTIVSTVAPLTCRSHWTAVSRS
jgi:hypothetical protein